ASAKESLAAGFATLIELPLYRRAVLGYCAHTSAVGGFAYWAPKFLNKHYSLELRTADVWFGVVTVVAGAIGTFVGGAMADRALAGLPQAPADATHVSRENKLAATAQLRVCAIGVAIAAPLAALCFVMP